MAIISTEAIVLRAIDYRETSKIAFFFTRRRGRVNGVLKGIRKNHKKFGSGVDKFSVNDVVYYEYYNREIHLVGQCDEKEFFDGFRVDEKRMVAADYACELVFKLMPLEECNEAVYDLLLNFFRAINIERDMNRFVHMFQIKFLALSGFRPHIDSCVICLKGFGDHPRFSMTKGGLVCRHCLHRASDAVVVSAGAIASLMYIESRPWEACLKLKISASIKQELKRILNNFLIFHLEKNIKSAKYL